MNATAESVERIAGELAGLDALEKAELREAA